MNHTIEYFSAMCRRALGEDAGLGGRKTICALVEDLIKDGAFTAMHLGEEAPERKVLYEDPELGFRIVAHYYKGPGEFGPHDHGSSWAIYGQAGGETVMSDWAVVDPAAPSKAGKVSFIRSYTLKPGMVRLYNEGDVHSLLRDDSIRLIRIEGKNLADAQPLAYQAI